MVSTGNSLPLAGEAYFAPHKEHTLIQLPKLRPISYPPRVSAFPNWQTYAVPQRRQDTGCIPTGYEIILRTAKAEGINFETFQDDFDLDKNGGQPRNSFGSVAEVVKAKYPQIDFKSEAFQKGDGAKKLARVEEFIREQRPVLISLANAPAGGRGWHIMLVVDSSDDTLTLLDHVEAKTLKPVTKVLPKKLFVEIHDKFPGGDDIAYLSTTPNPAHYHE